MGSYDPVARMWDDPLWQRRLLDDLPSRRRLTLLRHEHERQRRRTAPTTVAIAPRIASAVGGLLIRLGERLWAVPAATVSSVQERSAVLLRAGMSVDTAAPGTRVAPTNHRADRALGENCCP